MPNENPASACSEWKVPWLPVKPWQPLPEPTDVLFYEGLHGGVVTPQHDVARHVDLLVGVVPIVNLEWIQKLTRDTSERGHSREAVMDSVVRSMEDLMTRQSGRAGVYP
jgi:phosphoribulokinase